jgi:dihydrofolate synthase/folylpolyglutamate synthase
LAVTVLKHLRQNPEGLFKGICDYRMEQAVRTGLERAQLGGRMEALEGTPELVLDGAHNPGAAAQLRLALDARYPDQPGIFVMGAFEDKNYLEVAKRVIHQEVCVMTVQAPGPRGLSAAQLKEELEPLTDHAVAAYEDVFLALQDAKMQAQVYQELHGVSPYILCFGSLSWLAGAQNAWRLLQGQTLNI